MIIGDCPYVDCDHIQWTPIADAPCFERHECEACHRVVWTRHSRVDPWSMTEADFLAAYDVDAATKKITPRASGSIP